ncbi:MAG: hypothetical protein ABJG41_00785 [Cyclobacteriaceae bacterium]
MKKDLYWVVIFVLTLFLIFTASYGKIKSDYHLDLLESCKIEVYELQRKVQADSQTIEELESKLEESSE